MKIAPPQCCRQERRQGVAPPVTRSQYTLDVLLNETGVNDMAGSCVVAVSASGGVSEFPIT